LILDLVAAVSSLVLVLVFQRRRNFLPATTLVLFLLPLQEAARPLRILTALLVAGLFLGEIARRFHRKESLDLWIPALLLPLVTSLSLVVHPTIVHPLSRIEAGPLFLNSLSAVAIFHIIRWHVRSEDDAIPLLRRFALLVLAGSAVALLLSLVGATESIADWQAEMQVDAGLPVFAERSFLFFRHPNQNAYFAALGLVLLFARGLTRDARKREKREREGWEEPASLREVERSWKDRRRESRLALLLGTGAVVVATNLILSGSRGAILALPCAGLVGLVLARRLRLLTVSMSTLFLVLPLLLVMLLSISSGDGTVTEGEQLASRLRDLTSPGSALRTRPILWQGALSAFLRSPILGVGPTNLPYHFLYETPRMFTWSEEFLSTAPAHSLYLHVLATTGLLGLVSFLVLVGALLHRLVPGLEPRSSASRQELAFVGLMTLLFLLMIGLLGHTVIGIYSFNTSIFFAFFSLSLCGAGKPGTTRERQARGSLRFSRENDALSHS